MGEIRRRVLIFRGDFLSSGYLKIIIEEKTDLHNLTISLKIKLIIPSYPPLVKGGWGDLSTACHQHLKTHLREFFCYA